MARERVSLSVARVEIRSIVGESSGHTRRSATTTPPTWSQRRARRPLSLRWTRSSKKTAATAPNGKSGRAQRIHHSDRNERNASSPRRRPLPPVVVVGVPGGWFRRRPGRWSTYPRPHGSAWCKNRHMSGRESVTAGSGVGPTRLEPEALDGVAHVDEEEGAKEERGRSPRSEPGHLNALHVGAKAYLHGHEVGGTDPSLLTATGCGNLVMLGL